MNFQLSMKRAVTELLVLKLLTESDLCCMQCAKRIESRSKGQIVITESLLFPVFQHLDASGYISWYGKEGRKQQFYHLEEKGQTYYRKAKEDFFQMTKEVARFLR